MNQIDLPLLRLRYEILNVPIHILASELSYPVDVLAREAQLNNWEQWWPDLEDLETALDSSTHPDSLDFEELSPLEEGANRYIKEATVRLKVFNLAKDMHLSHKFAALESALVDRAKDLVDSAAEPSELRNLVLSLKDLPGRMNSQMLSQAKGEGDEGIPTVIIRDLTGR